MGLGPGRFNEFDLITREGSLPPAVRGLYRFHDRHRCVLRVGMTCNLKRRLGEWERSDALADVVRFSFKKLHGNTSWETLGELEAAQIVRHDPPMNKRSGGGGRPPEG
jgi:hypothetical protein